LPQEGDLASELAGCFEEQLQAPAAVTCRPVRLLLLLLLLQLCAGCNSYDGLGLVW
jgi:hypothetical protein